MKASALGLLDEPTRARAIPALALAAIGGGLSAALLPLAELGMVRSVDAGFYVLVIAYVLALGGSFGLRTWASTRACVAFERRLQRLEAELVARLQAAPLRAVEAHSQLDQAFSRDLETLRYVPRIASSVVYDAVLLAGVTIFIAWLSPVAALVWIVSLALMIRVLRTTSRTSLDAADEVDADLAGLAEDTRRAFDSLAQLKLDVRLAEGLRAELDASIARVHAGRGRRDLAHAGLEARATVTVLAIEAALLFALPGLGLRAPSTIALLVALVLFVEGSVFDLVHNSQYLIGAEGAWRNLEAWKAQLPAEGDARAGDEDEPSRGHEPVASFERIELEGARFGYDDARAFELGPIDLSLRSGEVVFIIGANGSGKTTLMKLLCGLYRPRAGVVRLDGAALEPETLGRHRGLISAVFSEHRLFERAYGLDLDDPERVDELLARFALAGVTGLEGDRFTTLALSSGQAKRLAMVVALLEDRPLLVLDEWAAHQDPQLRQAFYEHLLPELRAQGKTIVAISHDERFFACADRVLRLHEGRLIEELQP